MAIRNRFSELLPEITAWRGIYMKIQSCCLIRTEPLSLLLTG